MRRLILGMPDGARVELPIRTLDARRVRRVAVGPDGAQLRPVDVVDGAIRPARWTTGADVDVDGRPVDAAQLRPVDADGRPVEVAASTIDRPVDATPIAPVVALLIRARSILATDAAPAAPMSAPYAYQSGVGPAHVAIWTATDDGRGVVVVGDPVALDWIAPGEVRDWSETDEPDADPWGDP